MKMFWTLVLVTFLGTTAQAACKPGITVDTPEVEAAKSVRAAGVIAASDPKRGGLKQASRFSKHARVTHYAWHGKCCFTSEGGYGWGGCYNAKPGPGPRCKVVVGHRWCPQY